MTSFFSQNTSFLGNSVLNGEVIRKISYWALVGCLNQDLQDFYRAHIFSGNISFESGFSGFSGLGRTSLVGVAGHWLGV